MKKKYGITFGGLQQKILGLVLVFMLILTAVFGFIMTYWSRDLAKLVSNTRIEQQNAITGLTEETLHSTVEKSLVKTNSLQAYIADDVFADVQNDVLTLQTFAAGLFAGGHENIQGHAELPDASNDGKVTAQILFEDGVDYTNSEYLKTAFGMIDIMTAMYKNSGKINNCYIGLCDGTHLCVDEMSSNKFDENGNLKSYYVRRRPWYTNAALMGDVCFSDIITDLYTGKLCITCSAPVYTDGELIGVVGIDLFLDSIEDYVNSSAENGAFICIVSGSGKVIFAPGGNGIFDVETGETAEDIRLSENKELAEFVSDALISPTGLRTVTVGNGTYYMAGTPISTMGWCVISASSKEYIDNASVNLISEFDDINDRSAEKYRSGRAQSSNLIVLIVSVIIIIGLYSALLVANRILKPVESMTEEIIEGGTTGKMFEMKELYRTGDEIEVLAESFDALSKKVRDYILDITTITKEKERIATELELAKKIQANMLPDTFPPFPGRTEFDIYGKMTPAKEVGGDFFDFFLLDDDHLALVMADVSGKGIPAALFMMVSKILIKNFAVMGSSASPKEVLEKTNEMLCSHNKEQMFVTVWMGVLEIPTGKIRAVNAGHEYPVIRQPGGQFEIFKDKHGFVIGGMSGLKYTEYEIELKKGGTLFLYTDGVPEATNASSELFGMDRLLESMNSCGSGDPEKLLDHVHNSVNEFVGEAPQFDDLTMLCITLKE